jgi:lysophospholipid acyltransferase (LPLAT)-like uncharacterized protein
VAVENKLKFTLAQRLVLAVAPRVVWALLWIVSRTWRFEVIAEEGVTPVVFGQKPGAGIYCFWHQCVLPCTVYYRRTHAVIIVSESFDGELITRILKLFGYDAVRGSSSHGGRGGMMGLAHVIQCGRPAIFTADGPRGPIYQTKMGPIKLAQMTGAPIGCFHLEPERAWVMPSWDHFLIPKPFTRICVSWARLTHVAAGLHSCDFEPKRQELNAALERARLRAYQHFGRANA